MYMGINQIVGLRAERLKKLRLESVTFTKIRRKRDSESRRRAPDRGVAAIISPTLEHTCQI